MAKEQSTDGPPRVLFLIQHPDLPSSRVRVLTLLPDLKAAGLAADVLPYPATLRNKIRLFMRLQRWDVVVVQKKLPTPWEAACLKRCCHTLVYDVDDAVYCRHESEAGRSNRSRQAKFRAIVSRADLILAGNAVLARAAKAYHRHVEVLPSSVEVRQVPVHATSADGPLVIGWVGGTINLSHLMLLQPVLARLYRVYPFELRVVSGRPLDMGTVPTRFLPWSLETQEAEIAAFDIGLMPLPASQHAAGKCGYKALQYMASGVAPVASDTETNRNIITHGKDGLLAARPDDFYPHLAALLQDPQLRQDMGRQARQTVTQHFCIEKTSTRLAHLLRAATGTTHIPRGGNLA